MKRFLLFLLSGAFLVTLATGLTGCKGMVTKRQLISMIENSLKEKYKEEFKCIEILPNQNFNGSYTGVCHPVDDSTLMFEASMYTDGRAGADYYPTSIAASELSKVLDTALGNGLGDHFTYAYSNTGVHDTEIAQKIADNEFTLNYFLRHGNEVYHHNNTTQVNYTIIVDVSTADNSYEDEWDTILNALDSVHKLGLESDIDLYFRLWIYFVPTDVYTQCLGYFESNAQIRSGLETIAEGFPPEHKRIIHFDVGAKTWDPITKEQYVEQRREIN